MFDRTWHDDLIEKVIRLRFPGNPIKVIQWFHSDHLFQVGGGKELSKSRSIAAGVPQGSILSAILFNIFSSDIARRLRLIPALYDGDITLNNSDGIISSVVISLEADLRSLQR